MFHCAEKYTLRFWIRDLFQHLQTTPLAIMIVHCIPPTELILQTKQNISTHVLEFTHGRHNLPLSCLQMGTANMIE